MKGVVAMGDDTEQAMEEETGDVEQEGDVEEDDDVFDMDALMPCLLGDGFHKPPSKTMPHKPKVVSTGNKNASASSSFQTPHKASRATTSTHAPPSSASKGPAVSVASSASKLSPRADAGSPDGGDTEMAQVRKKFQGKSAEEVLKPHGVAKIQEAIDAFTSRLNKSPFSSQLQGGSLQEFKDALGDAKKDACSLQRSVVQLDLKVKKWNSVPEEVTKFVGGLRGKTKVAG